MRPEALLDVVEMAPRSRPTGLPETRTRRCWYFRSISTGATLRRMSAMVDSTIGRPAGAVTKILPRSSGRTRKGSSSCTTMLYWLPVRGSVKIDGFTLTFELSENRAAWATSRCEQAGGRGLLAVDDDAPLGIVALAADLDVGDARNVAHDPGHLAGGHLGVGEVVAEHLDLEGILRAAVQDPVHDPAQVEVGERARELAAEARPERRPRSRRRCASAGRASPGTPGPARRAGRCSRVKIAERPAGMPTVDTIDVELARLEVLADQLLDPGDDLLRLLDPGPDRRAQEDPELALVGGREELGADQRHQREAREEDREHARPPRPCDGRAPSGGGPGTRVEPIEEPLARPHEAVAQPAAARIRGTAGLAGSGGT